MTKRRSAPPPPPPPPPPRTGLPLPIIVAFGVFALITGVVVAIATTSGGSGASNSAAGGKPGAASADMGHVHALAVDPADGMLYAGTHHGVFRIPGSGGAARVGQSQQDMMGFVVTGPGRFLGSGHPAPGQGGPGHLGLIESTDGAHTWTARSLRGEADFHSLRYRHDTVYAYNSVTKRLMVSRDLAIWQSRSELALYSLAVSPDDPELLLATTPYGLARSTDGGRAWGSAGTLPLVLLDWPAADRLWAVGAAGEVYVSTDGGAQWDRRGTAGGQPTALTTHQDVLYLAMTDGSILRSTDGAATWTVLHR